MQQVGKSNLVILIAQLHLWKKQRENDMKKIKLSLAIGLLVAGFNVYASDDLSALKAQIAAQQAQLEKMMQQMQALEAKAQQVEVKVAPIATTAAVTEQKAASSYQGSLDQARAASRKLSDPVKVGGIKRNPFSGSNMNPDVAVILDGSYVNRGQSNSDYGALGMPGFFHGLGGAHEGHAHGGGYNMNNGFNLNYGELVFSAAVDKYFDLFAVIHAGESGAALEEAYANTRSLPFNTQLKFGKFLSGFGRLNGQHHHYWDFADQPLIYQGVFGSHGLLEKGVQATWLAPTRNYLLFGAEVLQGENEQSFGTKAISVKANKATSTEKETAFASQVDGAGLAVGFVKTGFDIGSTSWMAGASYGAGKMRLDHTSDEHGPHAKAGSVAITGLDLTGKYFLDATRYVMWQSEYIKRELTDGQVATYPSNSGGASDGLITPKLSQNQSGYYSQLIWKFAPQWRTGLRYDAIDQNSIKVNGVDKNTPYGDRNTVMVEYNPTEFSRIRLQYAQNGAFFTEENERKRFDEVLLQFNMAIGAHGAHSF